MSSRSAVKVSAPASLCILGDPGDLFGGSVLCCSVQKAATTEVACWPAFELWAGSQPRLIKWTGDLKTQHDEWDVGRVVLEFVQWGMEPAKITYSTAAPWGWGLGDHAPTLVALLDGLSAWKGYKESPYTMAETAYALEHSVLGFTGSLAAAYMAAFGGLCLLDFRGRGGPNSSPRVFGVVEKLHSSVGPVPLVAAHMGPGQPARDALTGLRERWLAGDRRVVESYQIVDRLVHEGKRALLSGDWEQLGKLMNENAIIQGNLTAVDSHGERLAEIALGAGAWGVRPVGAGEYGTIVALHHDPATLERAWAEAGAETIAFSASEEVGNE